MKLHEFYRELLGHDWYYVMSDDGRAYRAGKENLDRLTRLAHDLGEEYQVLMAEYSAFMHQKRGREAAPVPRPLYRGFRLHHELEEDSTYRGKWLVYKGDLLMEGEHTDIYNAMRTIDLFEDEIDNVLNNPMVRMMDHFTKTITEEK